MKTILKVIVAAAMLASLSGCVVAPSYPGYAEAGPVIVAPAPYYGPAYYGVGIEYRRGGWGRRW